MEGTERWSNLLIWAKVQTELWLGCSGKEELVWAAGWALLYNSGPESLRVFFVFYKNIPRSPRCGVAGAFLQKVSLRICAEAPGGPVAWQRGGRPRPPGSGATASQRPPALVCFTKNSEKNSRFVVILFI